MWLLSFLNPILNLTGQVFTWLNKKQDVELEKFKVNGQIDINQVNAYVAVAVARANDRVDAWGRRLLVYPTGVWYTLIAYDSCFRNLLPEWMTWRILDLPPSLNYIPLAVVGYLLITTFRR